MKPVILHREALEEFDAAAAYYSDINPPLGRRFYEAVDLLIHEARATPSAFRHVHKPARRHFSSEFPYAIIYIERANDLWVLAVMHLRRRPGYWKHRVK